MRFSPLAGLLLLLPAAAFAQAKKGTQYAFLVGCSGYSETQLKPLPYTVNDVEQFRQALLETGFEADHIKLLHDKQPLRYAPERKKILKEFAMLLDGLKPEDTVVVALSGHGVHFKKDATGYFCPLDADLKDKTSLIPFEGKDGLFDQLKACKAKRKLLIVNACRNDPTSDRAQAAEKINLDDATPETVPEGIAAIYSCKPGQKSYYDPKREQGIFFDHMTKAWRGDYAKGLEHVTIEDVFREVTTRTKIDADKVYGESQVPEVKREYTEEWRLAVVNALAGEYREYEAAWKLPKGGIPWFEQNAPKRFAEWRRMADGGNVLAMELTGFCYALGKGAEKDEKQAVEWYRKAADRNHPPGMYEYAWCLLSGLGVEKDQKSAVEWYRKAVQSGHLNSLIDLGRCYMNGEGVTKDEKQGVELYLMAANRGNQAALIRLGVCHRDGAGVPKDGKQAVAWYRKAADLGNRQGMYSLSSCYVEGAGVEQDDALAVEWRRKANECGEADAIYTFGYDFQHGNQVAKDEKRAVGWYRKGVALGHSNSMLNLGYCYKHGVGLEKDIAQGIEWYRKAADLGNSGAMCNLGIYHSDSGPQYDNKLAFNWFRKSADLENSSSMVYLARMYRDGAFKVVDKDVKHAIEIYMKAASLKNLTAMHELADVYAYGADGVPANSQKVVEWYQKAADLGDTVAMNELAWRYSEGYEIQKDKGLGLEWYRKAAKLGHKGAIAKLKELGKE